MLRRWRIAEAEWLLILILALITGVMFGAVAWRMIYVYGGSDYPLHILFARNMVEKNQFADVHILFQALIIGVARLTQTPLENAAWLVATLCYVITAVILYALVRSALGGGWIAPLLSAVAALALLLVAPVNLLTLPEKNLYFGYIGISVYHSPTIVLLKPFALLLFAFTVAVLDRSLRWRPRTLIAGWLLVTLALLAKPNDVLVLLPALLVVIAYRFWRRDRSDFKTLIGALVVPMILLLGVSYVLMYLFIGDGKSGVQFAPLAVVFLYGDTVQSALIKFVLSALFPLIVYLAYYRQALRDLVMNVAWLTFLAGVGQMYLFAESGPRFSHANFWWGAQIGLFVLFVVSLLFLLRHFRERPRWRGWLCLIVFALHLLSGVVYFVIQFVAVSHSEWW